MSLSKYIARLQRMDLLIAIKATGFPGKFSDKWHRCPEISNEAFLHLRECLMHLRQIQKGSHLAHFYLQSQYSNIQFITITPRLELSQPCSGNNSYCEILNQQQLKVFPNNRAATILA